MSFCRNCGYQLTYEDEFCPRCKTPTNYTYSDLVSAADDGDSSAVSALYKRTYKDKYYIAFKYMKNKDDAEDVLQDAYVRAFGHLSSLTDKEGFPYWLSTIVANTARNALKKKKPELFQDTVYENEEGEEMDPLLSVEDVKRTACPEENLMAKDRAQLIQELMSSLTEEQRICTMMYYLEEMKVKDIAAALDMNENTVKSRLFQARKALMQKGEAMKKRGYVFSITPLPLLIRLLFSERFSLTGTAPVLPPISHGPVSATGGYQTASQAASQTISNAASSTAAGAAKGATVAAVKTGGGILASIGGKIAVGVLSAAVLGGAIFGGIKAVPKLLESRENNSEIVSEEMTDSLADEESQSELSDNDGEEIDQDAILISVYEAYKDILTQNKDSLLYEYSFDNHESGTPLEDIPLGDRAIAFYDIWGDETLEMFYCVAREQSDVVYYDHYYDHLVFCDLYCVTSSMDQIYYLTQDGLVPLKDGAKPLVDTYWWNQRLGYDTASDISPLTDNRGIFIELAKDFHDTEDLDEYIRDMTYQQIVIIPQNNSSDPFADVDTYSCDLHTHVEIVSKKESETTEIIGAYKNGVRVPDSEAESFLDGFSHDYNYYMLAGYEYDKYNLDHYLEPSALTYEEAIAFLNGEIVRFGGEINELSEESQTSQPDESSRPAVEDGGKKEEVSSEEARAIIPVYQAYKEILADHKASIGLVIATVPYPAEQTFTDLDREGAIAFYDVWGDGIKEMIFSSCRVEYGSLISSLYCVTSKDGQIYYMTADGPFPEETGAVPLEDMGHLDNKFYVRNIYAPLEGKGFFLDLNLEKYMILPPENSSDAWQEMQVERISTDIGAALDSYYAHGYGFSGTEEPITQEQFEKWMETFNNHAGTLLLSTDRENDSIGMNYEEAIAYLDGEIARLNAIINGTEYDPSQNSQKETREEADSNSSESETSSSKPEGYTTEDLPNPWGEDIAHKILDVVINGETLLESAEKGNAFDWIYSFYHKAMENREQGANFGTWLLEVAGYHDAKAAGWGQAWLQACSDSQETRAYINNATASSELDESNIGSDHSADTICDGSLMNAWCEGAAGYGIDEWVKLELGPGFAVSSMEFHAGYQKSSELYYANGRPAEILIVFDEGDGITTSETVMLEDVFGSQTITFNTIHYAETITIYIKSVYEGTTYEDTLISEVSFN